MNPDAPSLAFIQDRYMRDPDLRRIDLELQILLQTKTQAQLLQVQEDMLRVIVDQANARVPTAPASGYAEALDSLSGVIEEGFDSLSGQLDQIVAELQHHGQLLDRLYKQLANQLESRVRERRSKAREMLRLMLDSQGEDRQQNRADCIALIKRVQQDEFGATDPLSWFYLGWLYTVEDQDLGAGLVAMTQAKRLSKHQPDFHLYVTRFYAHVLYKLDRFEEAFQALHEVDASVTKASADALFEMARYSARCGNPDEAIGYLESAIDLRPLYAELALLEKDLEGASSKVEQVITARWTRIKSEYKFWTDLMDRTDAIWRDLQRVDQAFAPGPLPERPNDNDSNETYSNTLLAVESFKIAANHYVLFILERVRSRMLLISNNVDQYQSEKIASVEYAPLNNSEILALKVFALGAIGLAIFGLLLDPEALVVSAIIGIGIVVFIINGLIKKSTYGPVLMQAKERLDQERNLQQRYEERLGQLEAILRPQ